jgi:hypothetical protein
MARALDGFANAGVNEQVERTAADEKAVRDMLYSVENLRKRPGAED